MKSIEDVITFLLQIRYPVLEGLELLVTLSGINQNDGKHQFSFASLDDPVKSGRGEFNEHTQRFTWFYLDL